jgi:hypothetical protein
MREEIDIARELAPRLDKLIADHLRDGRLLNPVLEQFLWENKVGILRVLQYCADEEWA